MKKIKKKNDVIFFSMLIIAGLTDLLLRMTLAYLEAVKKKDCSL